VDGTTLPFETADEIWDQCRIQFRMITCPGSNEGCPDLVVNDPNRIAPSSTCESGPFGGASAPEAVKNWSEAEDLPGVNKDLPIVTFAWRIASAGCPIADVARKSRAAMGIGAEGGTGLALAHELGHVLGLPDASNCRQRVLHLMCNAPDETAPNILPEHCVMARTAAAQYVKEHWGG
jgi:hypothetical protein